MNAPPPPVIPPTPGKPQPPAPPVLKPVILPPLPPIEQESADPPAAQPNTRLPLPPGSIVGEYTIISKLGKGGFGITYRAKHTQTGSIVVIKEHIPEGMAMRMQDGASVAAISPETEENFRSTMTEFMEEASILMGLEHPGIVPIQTAFEANGTAYYAMPFVEGSTLQIPEKPTLDKEKKAAEARRVKQLLRAMLFTLEYLEQHNIVHRDIKPENILVNEENRPILLDFGSARQLQQGKIFNNIYTPDFCAPEQSTAASDAEMSQNISTRTDIYSLGACFYYLISRLLPPRADMRIHASPDPYKPLAGRKDLELYYEHYLLQSIDRALCLDPKERWQDAATWRMSTESGIVPPPRAFVLRMRIYLASALVIIILLGTLSIWVWRQKNQAEQMYLNGITFTEGLLHDFNTELADLPGATQLQKKLGTNLKNYLNSMESLPIANDARLQHSIATAWQNLGSVWVQQGKLEDASDSYRKASELLEKLHDDEPTDVRVRYEMAKVLQQRAEIARRRNRIEEAYTLNKNALQYIRQVCKEVPNNPDYQCTLGETIEIATLISESLGDLAQRKAELHEMLRLYQQLVQQYPNHERSLQGLAKAQIRMASHHMDNNDFVTASALLDESKENLYTLRDLHPHRLSFQHSLSSAHYTMGTMFNRLATVEKSAKKKKQFQNHALESFELCIQLARALETMDRENAEYPFQLCRSMSHIADIAMSQNEFNKAERYSRDTLSRINALLVNAPNNADYQQIRAGVLRNLAMVHSKNEAEQAKATAEFAEYRQIIRDLLQQSPNSPMLKYMYADALSESAIHANKIGDTDTAQQWLREAELYLDKNNPNYKQNSVWASKLEMVQKMLRDMTKDVAAQKQ